jgi:hypothetical protein
MRALLAFALLLTTVSVAMAETASIRLGQIAIDYDPARWTVTRLTSGAVNFACLGDDCRLARGSGRGVTVSTRPAGTGRPTPDALEALRETRDIEPMWSEGLLRQPARHDFGGITFTGYRMFSRCRAYTPMMQYAAGSYGASDYVFAGGLNAGCGGVEGVSRKRFEELLNGIRIVEGGDR